MPESQAFFRLLHDMHDSAIRDAIHKAARGESAEGAATEALALAKLMDQMSGYEPLTAEPLADPEDDYVDPASPTAWRTPIPR